MCVVCLLGFLLELVERAELFGALSDNCIESFLFRGLFLLPANLLISLLYLITTSCDLSYS